MFNNLLTHGFVIFQPNGRFETQTKICLSISNHHPEHWQPSWSGNFIILYTIFALCYILMNNSLSYLCISVFLLGYIARNPVYLKAIKQFLLSQILGNVMLGHKKESSSA